MNREPEDQSQLLHDLATWCSAEPGLLGEPSYRARTLIDQFCRQRKRRRHMAWAAALSLCLAGSLLIYFRAPAAGPLSGERSTLADGTSDSARADPLTESADEFVAQFALEAAAVDQRNRQIQEQLERMADKFQSRSQGGTSATIDGLHAARRQRAHEQVLDRWLAANP